MTIQTLSHAALGQALVVQSVQARPESPDWAPWLEEIGFLPGEHVSLIARAMPGGDPLVVRVGHSTFALRRAEAGCVEVASAESYSPTADDVAPGGAAPLEAA